METSEKAKRLAYFQNLYKVAVADGILAAEEKYMLSELSQRLGLHIREASEIMLNIKNLELVIPDSEEEQVQQLEEIVSMMAIDGTIHAKEYALCLTFAKNIGRTHVTLDRILEKLKQQ